MSVLHLFSARAELTLRREVFFFVLELRLFEIDEHVCEGCSHHCGSAKSQARLPTGEAATAAGAPESLSGRQSFILKLMSVKEGSVIF